MRLPRSALAAMTLLVAGSSARAQAQTATGDGDAPAARATRTGTCAPGAASAPKDSGKPDATAPARPEQIVVQAERRNQTHVVQGGQLGALGTLGGLDAPFAVKSYTAALILNQQSETLGQVLENDPSVRTTLGFGNFAELFVIRGLPVDGDDVSIDGLYGIAPRQLVDPNLYDEVQVLNGPGAFLNGAAPGGSVGGNINLTMKRAGDTPLMRVTGDYTSDGLGGGAVDMGRRFGADDRFGGRINVAGYDGQDYIDQEHQDSLVAGGGFDYRGDQLRVSLDLDYQDKGVDWGRQAVFLSSTLTSVPAVPSNTRNYGEPWADTHLQDRFGLLHVDYDLLPNLTFYAAGGLRDSDENGDYSTITVANAITGDGTSDRFTVPRTDDNASLRSGLRLKASTGPIGHALEVGISSIWETNRNAYTESAPFETDLYDTPVVPYPATAFSGGDNDDPYPLEKDRLQSVYGSDTISVLRDRGVVIVGVRDQDILTRSYSYTTGQLSQRYQSSKATPVVGVVVHPTARTSLYFNRIEGLAAGPTASGSGSGSEPLTNLGEVFPATVTTQYEVGAKVDMNRVSSSLAFFTLSQPNSYTRDNGNKTQTFVVDGDERNRGIEWSVQAEPARGLRVIGGASYIDARQLRTGTAALDGKQAIGVPDYLVNANVEYDLPWISGATLTGRLIRTGSQQVNAANTLQVDPWWRLDLGARYTFLAARKPWTVRFGVDNVSDDRYWASAFGGYLVQGPPRTYKLSLTVDL